METHLGYEYQQATKYQRDAMPSRQLDMSTMPDSYREYDGPHIPLPKPNIQESLSLWDTLAKRMSIRRFSGAPLSLEIFGQLLWGTYGATRVAREKSFFFRTAPSAGGLFPVEMYVSVHRVASIESGLYHYSVPRHGLTLLKEGNFGKELAEASLSQGMLKKSAVNLIWTAVLPRTFWKYGERGIRYIYLDAGHVGQNTYLVATALGLGCCTIGAFFDDEVNQLIGVDGKSETTIYMASVGNPD
ncbi:SagB/ThcOx family dehydrogenase [Heliobacterium chlorum]|uniref:SagB/ThcOx family dehydrogenase n=1 Tax=Heliobacterium chlorum TaxID=2698 RepID=A0ABR7T498_HELCL|nr:SagB/ThcOx family dehydrogenase [Heliobacterium chlorum]MBC9785597.1 SagB/ThcOx family dehydrogenase [Heliobacterium chlorum]